LINNVLNSRDVLKLELSEIFVYGEIC